MKIGAQLYTVWSKVKTLEGIDDSFGKIKNIGYDVVQLSSTCPFEAEWMRDTLAKHDLKCVLTHVNPDKLIEDPITVIKEHKTFGCEHIGIGAMPNDMRETMEGYERFRDTFVPVAKILQDNGAKFMYHNHWFEFTKLNGMNVFERMLEDFPEGSVEFILDLAWADYAGEDLVKLISMLRGKLSRIHLKDHRPLVPEDGETTLPVRLCPIYEGTVDFDTAIRALYDAGTEYALVEQDLCFGEDEFECLKRSYDNVLARFPELK